MAGRIDLPTLVQRVKVDTSGMARAEKRAQSFAQTMREASADIDASNDRLQRSADGAAESGEQLNAELRRTERAAKPATDALKRHGKAAKDAGENVEGMSRRTRKAADETERLGDEVDRTNRKMRGFGGGGNKGFLGFLKGFRGIARPAMYVGLASMVSPAITALNSLGAAGFAVAGGLAPATGVVATLPGLLLPAVAGFLSLKTALSGTGGAAAAIAEFGVNSEEAKKALAGLAPEARTFAKELSKWAKAGREAADITRQFALPGLTRGLKAANPLLSVFRDVTKDIAKQVGGAGEGLGKFVGSKSFVADMKTLGASTSRIFGSFTKTLQPIVSILRNIVLAAGPAAETLAKAGVSLAKFFDQKTSDRKGLTAFFSKSADAFISLSKSIGSAVGGLIQIGSIGADVFGGTKGITGAIEKTAKKFNEWTKSAKGRDSIKRYFEDLKPVAKEVGLLAVDVIKGLATLGRDKNTAALISQIRTDLLPALITLLQKASDFAPALVDLVTGFADFASALDPVAVAAVASAVGELASAIGALVKHVPGLGEIISLLLAYKALQKGLGRINIGLPNLTGGGGIAGGGRRGGGGGGGVVPGGGGKGPKGGGGSRTTGGGGVILPGGRTDRKTNPAAQPGATRQTVKEAQKVGKNNLKAIRGLKGASALALLASFIDVDALFNEATKNTPLANARKAEESKTPIALNAKPGAGALRPGQSGGLPFRKGKDVAPALSRDQINNIIDSQPIAQMGVGGGIDLSGLRKNVERAMSDLRGTLSRGLADAGRVAGQSTGFITGAIGTALSAIPDLGTVASEGLNTFLNTGLGRSIQTAVTNSGGITGAIRNGLSRIPGLGFLATDGLNTSMATGLATTQGTATTGSGGITGVIRSALNLIPGIGSSNMFGLNTNVGSGLATAQGTAGTGAAGVTGAVRTNLAPIPGVARGSVDRAAAEFGSLEGKAAGNLGDGSTLHARGAQLMGMLASGIRSAAGTVGSAMSYIGGIIADHVPGSPVKTGPLTKFNNGGVGLRLTEMLAAGLTAGQPNVAAAMGGLTKSIAAGVTGPIGATPMPVAGPVVSPVAAMARAGLAAPAAGVGSRDVTVNIGDINNPTGESSEETITKALTLLQTAGVLG